jgi:N-carbamoyl-L-amino-acid hydrolase
MAKLQRMEACLAKLIQESNRRERCTARYEAVSRAVPALCDPAMMTALPAAAEQESPGLWQPVPSGAGHDSQYIAERMPVAMLFTPSINGISHHWAEDTKDEDLVLGCQILADAVQRYLTAN